jgi:hypothetical protein
MSEDPAAPRRSPDEWWTLKETGAGAFDMYDGDWLIARIVSHPAGMFRPVDLKGKTLSTQSYNTPKLAARYVPRPSGRTIEVHVERSGTPRRLVGELLPFTIQPTGKDSGDLGGVIARFEWEYGQVVRVIVATQAEANALLASLAPKGSGDA